MITLKQNDRDKLFEYYGSKLKIYGYDTRSLGWVPGGRSVRFGVMTSIADLNGSSILDVGCGFGDLYGHLTGRDIKVDYTGVDINPDLIKVAREVYPEARFFISDFESDGIDGEYDWAFAAGIFTIKITDNRSFIRNTLKRMYEVTRKGFAVDFLSPTYYSPEEDTYWRCPPEEVLKYCRSLSRRVMLR